MKHYSVIIFFAIINLSFNVTLGAQVVVEGIGINGIVVIGESKKDIKNKYGLSDMFLIKKYKKMASTHPHNVRSSTTRMVEKLGRSKITFYYQKLNLYISFDENNLVKGMYFKSEKYKTSKGLSVGDSREKAYSLYREGDSCQPILQNPSEGIDIVFDCNIVSEIRIYKAH
jgi:hypothetical protein